MLPKHMHEFHAGRDHGMCNIQNRTIPEVQLTHLHKLFIKNFEGTGAAAFSIACSNAKCFSTQAAKAM
jgi:hypothetical protein